MRDTCKRLVYWGQYGPTCWFNALLMVVFYSQLSRERIIQASKSWDTNVKIYKIFNHILKYKFVRSKKPEKDHAFFKRIKAENILKLLHNYNPKFVFNPTKYKKRGFSAEFYIKKFYKMLGISSLFFVRFGPDRVAYHAKNHLDYSAFDLSKKRINFKIKFKLPTYVQNRLKTIPDILFVEAGNTCTQNESWYQKSCPHYLFKNNELASLNDTITFNNTIYKLDSVLLNNWNIMRSNHTIAGITCNNERYV